jgi:hypothetical protein
VVGISSLALAATCAARERFVAPYGSDLAPGTFAQPWRTLGHAVQAAQPGDDVKFLAGVYGGYGIRTDWTAQGSSGAPITFDGGGHATIRGYNKIVGSHLRVVGFSFRGPTGPVDARTAANPAGEEVMIWIAGGYVEVAHSEVTGSRWHAGIYVSGPGGVRIIADYVHRNGAFGDRAQANIDHGIYWGHGGGGVIADSVIAGNLADGVQLYPDATHVVVEQNTIVGNGKSGILISGRAAHNVVVDNIIAGNRENSVRTYELTGRDNVAENNLVWHNGDGNIGRQAAGLTLRHNLRANPRFVGPHNFHLKCGSPALGKAVRTGASLLYDIDGVSRGRWPDLGAYQRRRC